jgi:hypothetical protein
MRAQQSPSAGQPGHHGSSRRVEQFANLGVRKALHFAQCKARSVVWRQRTNASGQRFPLF